MFELACDKALKLGYESIELIADPNAKDFYEHLGAKKTGEIHSKVLDVKRVLPKMAVSL